MISLSAAAATFNKAVFTDIESDNAFNAQILPFNDTLSSGPTSRRRIMETAPNIVVPGVVIMVETGEVFLTAKPSVDFFLGLPVRKKRPIIPAEENYAIKTVEEILNFSSGVTRWGTIDYIRREVINDSSDYLGGYSVTLPADVSISRDQYLIHGSEYYRARANSHIDELGFTVVELVKLPDAVQTLDITVKGEYDPVSETYASEVISPILCVVEDREKSFENTRVDALKTEDGDVTVNTLHACEVGDTIGVYDIIHKRVSGNVNILHCRRS